MLQRWGAVCGRVCLPHLVAFTYPFSFSSHKSVNSFSTQAMLADPEDHLDVILYRMLQVLLN